MEYLILIPVVAATAALWALVNRRVAVNGNRKDEQKARRRAALCGGPFVFFKTACR